MDTKQIDARALLSECDELLRVAYYAMLKMGLRDEGANCRNAHEVRMFAWHFSEAQTDAPEGVLTTGGGTYQALRAKLAEAWRTLPESEG